jgi:hypothetical protein
MAKKIDIPEKGRIPLKICVEFASNCERLGFQISNLLQNMDLLIFDNDEKKLVSLRDNYFKKYIGIISGHLKTVSKEFRDYIFGETADDDQDWLKLGRDSERLAYFAHNILNAIEVLVPSDDEKLKSILDENFRKTLLGASGVLKTVSYSIRNKKISKSKGE